MDSYDNDCRNYAPTPASIRDIRAELQELRSLCRKQAHALDQVARDGRTRGGNIGRLRSQVDHLRSDVRMAAPNRSALKQVTAMADQINGAHKAIADLREVVGMPWRTTTGYLTTPKFMTDNHLNQILNGDYGSDKFRDQVRNELAARADDDRWQNKAGERSQRQTPPDMAKALRRIASLESTRAGQRKPRVDIKFRPKLATDGPVTGGIFGIDWGKVTDPFPGHTIPDGCAWDFSKSINLHKEERAESNKAPMRKFLTDTEHQAILFELNKVCRTTVERCDDALNKYGGASLEYSKAQCEHRRIRDLRDAIK